MSRDPHARFTIRLHVVLALIGFIRRVFEPRTFRMAAVAKAALICALLTLSADPARAGQLTEARFAEVMDSVFGRGAWRMTGGYRTPEREDELRAQGAMTVRPGGLSRHSLGRPGAPGAFDLVVDGISPSEAENRLRRAGAPFARYQPKGTHGAQGPHLHLEPYGFGPVPASQPRFQTASSPKAQVNEGRATAVTIMMPAPSAGALGAARDELSRLRAGALQGRAQAQIELGQALALGYIVTRDFAEAQWWLAKAAQNPEADPDTQAVANDLFVRVTALLEQELAQQPQRGPNVRVATADQ